LNNIADLRTQPDETSVELAKAKTVGANAEETARLTKENEMLRAIVMRERQEEARREQAKKLMLAEFDKLQIKSDTLSQQIELLAAPITRLSNEELTLLKAPIVGISNKDPSSLKASLSVATNSEPSEHQSGDAKTIAASRAKSTKSARRFGGISRARS
jgi:hypothetical protein